LHTINVLSKPADVFDFIANAIFRSMFHAFAGCMLNKIKEV